MEPARGRPKPGASRLVFAGATASRRLQLAPSGSFIGRGSRRAASLARHGGRVRLIEMTLGRRSNSMYRPFQPTESRECVPTNTNSPAATSGLRTLSLSAALASSTYLDKCRACTCHGASLEGAMRGSATAGRVANKRSAPVVSLIPVAVSAAALALWLRCLHLRHAALPFRNEPESHLCYPNLQHRAVRFGRQHVHLFACARAARAGARGRARKASAANAHHDAPCVSGPSPQI
jgi:hypothetical protein